MIVAQPLIVFFSACMKGLMPIRRRGVFGMPDDPIYFYEGDTVPWWIECRWPLHMPLTFTHDVETYYENGHQVVRPLDAAGVMPIRGDGLGWTVVLVGAPTLIDGKPRPRRPKRIRTLRFADNFI